MDSEPILLLEDDAYVSYQQLIIFDSSVPLPGLDWSDAHFEQGFARRDSSVSVRTFIEYGDCRVYAVLGTTDRLESFQRVVAVPFFAPTGRVLVEGPEEFDAGREAHMPPGHYRLVICQASIDDEVQECHLYFERRDAPVERSELLVADAALAPPAQLLESAEIAVEAP